ncbi:hypothetical protein D3C78_955840 [compost metagenome]
MREESAIYDCEQNFRDFANCDNGMISWLLVTDLICCRVQSLSSLVGEHIATSPPPARST